MITSHNSYFNTRSSITTLEPELLYLSQEDMRALNHARSLLSPHHNSGRGRSIYFAFKVLAYGCLNYARYNPTHQTIGLKVKEYGYNKTLRERKSRQLTKTLVDAGLFVREKMGKLYRYTITELGKLTWHYIVLKNNGQKVIRPMIPQIDLSTDIQLAESQNYEEIKKVPVSDEKKCRSYIDTSYIEYITNHSNGSFVKANKPKSKPFMKSERSSKKTELPYEVKQQVSKHFRGEDRAIVESTLKRLTASIGGKNRLVEEIASARASLCAKAKKIHNLSGFIVHKYKQIGLNN